MVKTNSSSRTCQSVVSKHPGIWVDVTYEGSISGLGMYVVMCHDLLSLSRYLFLCLCLIVWNESFESLNQVPRPRSTKIDQAFRISVHMTIWWRSNVDKISNAFLLLLSRLVIAWLVYLDTHTYHPSRTNCFKPLSCALFAVNPTQPRTTEAPLYWAPIKETTPDERVLASRCLSSEIRFGLPCSIRT